MFVRGFPQSHTRIIDLLNFILAGYRLMFPCNHRPKITQYLYKIIIEENEATFIFCAYVLLYKIILLLLKI